MRIPLRSGATMVRRGLALAVGASLLVTALPTAANAFPFHPDPKDGSSTATARAPHSLSAAQAISTPEQRYTEQVYMDLFGRQVDPEGLATWTAALTSGTPRIAVADAITSSDEFRSQLITSSYAWYLRRTPDAGGLQFWLQKMREGWTIAQMESGFLSSDEFYGYAGSTASGWVGDLYGAILGRTPAPSEVDFWVGKLSTMSRQSISLSFLLSTEYLSGQVNGYYHVLLGRGLDQSGQRTWVGILQSGGRDEAVIGSIIASDEYWGYATAVS